MMSRLSHRAVLLGMMFVTIPSAALTAEEGPSETSASQLVYQDRLLLPNFQIDGKIAHIHSQGLFVTARHFYVTGRLERAPKRALLLRFDRSDPGKVEHVDLTLAFGTGDNQLFLLDHPGGFDFDGESFWIPLAVSKRNSKSLLLKFPHDPDTPLARQRGEEAFRVDDHIGAVAYDVQSKRLFGANWDTRLVSIWKTDGTLIERLPAERFVTQNAGRVFAVQDWKGIGQGRIVAGCVDKSPGRKPAESQAVLQWIDTRDNREQRLIRLAAPPERNVRLTHEGMAVRGEEVFFLPVDLGRNAEVFRYRWSKPVTVKK